MIFRIIIYILLFDLSIAEEWDTSIICSRKFNRCYQYFEERLLFNEAENKCIELGGHLVSIRDYNENQFVRRFGNLKLTPIYWIGVNMSATNTLEWNWTDGTSLTFINWGGIPTEKCSSVNNGTWNTSECYHSLPYMCTFAYNTKSIDDILRAISLCPSPIYLRRASCEIGWTYLPKTNSCYKVFHNANWNDSERSCVALGAHLTSIHSEVENTFINDLSSTGKEVINITEFAWIGLHQVGEEWVWTDGSKTDYFKWTSNQPDRERDNLCVQIASDVSYYKCDKEWNNLDCDSAMRAYVCKKPSES